MADPLYFAPLRVPVIDSRTGLMSREWYLFFQALWLRQGGSDGPSNDDIMQGIPEELGAAELLALTDSIAQAAGQVPVPIIPSIDDLLATLSALQDQLAEITKAIQGLQVLSLGGAGTLETAAEMAKRIQGLEQGPII
jgi:hypothetical protein